MFFAGFLAYWTPIGPLLDLSIHLDPKMRQDAPGEPNHPQNASKCAKMVPGPMGPKGRGPYSPMGPKGSHFVKK